MKITTGRKFINKFTTMSFDIMEEIAAATDRDLDVVENMRNSEIPEYSRAMTYNKAIDVEIDMTKEDEAFRFEIDDEYLIKMMEMLSMPIIRTIINICVFCVGQFTILKKKVQKAVKVVMDMSSNTISVTGKKSDCMPEFDKKNKSARVAEDLINAYHEEYEGRLKEATSYYAFNAIKKEFNDMVVNRAKEELPDDEKEQIRVHATVSTAVTDWFGELGKIEEKLREEEKRQKEIESFKTRINNLEEDNLKMDEEYSKAHAKLATKVTDLEKENEKLKKKLESMNGEKKTPGRKKKVDTEKVSDAENEVGKIIYGE